MEEKTKILCVEDDFDIRSNISDILRDEGYEVLEADNGKSGFKIFCETEPDLVISDVMMPECDGFELLKMIRSNQILHNHNVPFILLSALGQKDDVIKGIDNLANDYLIKPVDFDLLLAKVREKTHNASLVNKHYGRNIDNIKNQISEILPYEIYSHLNAISETISNIKSEPYGKLATNYISQLEKVHLEISRLRYLIHNNLDKETIDRKLKVNEQILGIYRTFEDVVASLGIYSKSHIEIEKPYKEAEMPKFRIDKSVIDAVLIKIFTSIFSVDSEAKIKISFLFDHYEQLVVIFYLNSLQARFSSCIKENEIKRMLDCLTCRFEVVENRENAAIITIPSYRLS